MVDDAPGTIRVAHPGMAPAHGGKQELDVQRRRPAAAAEGHLRRHPGDPDETDHVAGLRTFHELEAAGKSHPIEVVGERLRAMMPWIAAGKTKVQEASGGQG